MFIYKVLFKRLCFPRLLILKTEVDYNGRCETPVGIAGRLRLRRLAEEASSRHTEREHPGVVINYAF
jgi:hypothetical protein